MTMMTVMMMVRMYLMIRNGDDVDGGGVEADSDDDVDCDGGPDVDDVGDDYHVHGGGWMWMSGDKRD